MKSFNPLSQVHSFQEQLEEAIQDKDPCAAQVFEDFIDQLIETYSLKTCPCCATVFDGREDYCEKCRVEAAQLRASDEQDYQSRNFL